MNKTLRMVFALLFFSLLFSACRPLPSMPPPKSDDPLGDWRADRQFMDAQVILHEKAVNFPVLIVENLTLDWEAFQRAALRDVPDSVRFTQEARYHRDTDFMDKNSYGDAYYSYDLYSDVYRTAYSDETVWIYQDRISSQYGFRKEFENLPVIGASDIPDGSDEDVRYCEEEALELLLGVMADCGVPVDELELHAIEAHSEKDYFPAHIATPYGGRGYGFSFRHMLYELPVYDRNYSSFRDSVNGVDPADIPHEGHIDLCGQSASGRVSDLGVRHLRIMLRRVIEVEQYHVPILSLSDAIAANRDELDPLGRVERIELMLVPTYYSAEFETTRFRLVPAWCFLSRESSDGIIDARDGTFLYPLEEHWRMWQIE